MPGDYDTLMQLVRETHALASCQELLEWDQETYMPPTGVVARAEQLAALARTTHERQTDPRIGELLDNIDGALSDPLQLANLRETRRDYDRAVKIPSDLVAKIAKAASHGQKAWATAREESAFSKFEPHLVELLDLKREVAELLGYGNEPYDALLDEFEPGETAETVAKVFDDLRGPLSEFVAQIAGATKRPDESIVRRKFPRADQETFARKLSEAVGFNFQSGRIDVSTHPFCSGATPSDVRLTTRYNERHFSPAIFGVLHETGHGLYQQGLDSAHMFTPMGSAVSLGIHESQSRLWENMVGRSRAFWEHFYPDCKATFPAALGDVSLDGFVGAVNAVQPSFIRVEADEVTYNLHIILRFELERAMVAGKLAVHDIPDAWNAKMKDLLGITPESDADGCLQDIHWSFGAFGYFPTYALGNLYAAQFHAAAERDLGDLNDPIRRGDFKPLLVWLRENIHRHGQQYRAAELVKRVTGEPLSTGPLLTYLRDKFAPIYGL